MGFTQLHRIFVGLDQSPRKPNPAVKRLIWYTPGCFASLQRDLKPPQGIEDQKVFPPWLWQYEHQKHSTFSQLLTNHHVSHQTPLHSHFTPTTHHLPPTIYQSHLPHHSPLLTLPLSIISTSPPPIISLRQPPTTNHQPPISYHHTPLISHHTPLTSHLPTTFPPLPLTFPPPITNHHSPQPI